MDARPTRVRLIVGGIVIAAALVVGYLVLRGDGNLSSDEFTAEADRICSESQNEFDDVQRTPPRTADQAEKQADALISISEDALSKLRDLQPPAELDSSYDRYLAEREKVLAYLEDGREAAAANDPKGYAAAKRNAAAQQATRLQLARSLGLRKCSRPSVTLDGKS